MDPLILLVLLSEIDPNLLSGEEAMSIFLPDIEGWEKRFAFEDDYVKEQLNQDLTMAFTYRNNDTMIYVGVQISKSVHVWEDSLLKEQGPKAKIIESRDITILDDPFIKGRLLIFIRPNSTQEEAVLYWFEDSKFKIGSSIEDRYVLISLWNYVKSLKDQGLINNTVDIEEAYLSFARPIALHWEDLRGSRRDSNYLLIIIPLVAAIIILALALYERRVWETKPHSLEM